MSENQSTASVPSEPAFAPPPQSETSETTGGAATRAVSESLDGSESHGLEGGESKAQRIGEDPSAAPEEDNRTSSPSMPGGQE